MAPRSGIRAALCRCAEGNLMCGDECLSLACGLPISRGAWAAGRRHTAADAEPTLRKLAPTPRHEDLVRLQARRVRPNCRQPCRHPHTPQDRRACSAPPAALDAPACAMTAPQGAQEVPPPPQEAPPTRCSWVGKPTKRDGGRTFYAAATAPDGQTYSLGARQRRDRGGSARATAAARLQLPTRASCLAPLAPLHRRSTPSS